MKSFSQFLSESKDGKNLHLTHIEDRVIYGGVEGSRNAIAALRAFRDMLAGSGKGRFDVTVKWDGAPAIFAGIDPSDGKFFVAKKGIFNKNPKIYKSVSEIRSDTSGDLADKLTVAYNELKDLGIVGVIQGDIMFTNKDLSIENIEGEKHITFQPNTIVYAIPVKSDLAKTISRANLGVVFHTSYSGSSFETMKASFGVDIKSLKKKTTIWYQDAEYKDLSGTVTLTDIETKEVTAALSKAGKIFQRIAGTTLRELQSNAELARYIETYNNSLVRRGEKVSNTKKHVNGLINWFHDKFGKEMDTRKSEKGKLAIKAKLDKILNFFSRKNKENLDLVFQLQNAIVDAKLIIISKLDKVKQMGTFIRTKNGFKVTGSEGFVAIDRTNEGAVKLVDRLEFSKHNFSDDVIRGWEK